MREIKINNKEIGFKASPLSLLFYKQEFRSDLLGDLASLKKEGEQMYFDSVAILQIGWALNRSYNLPEKTKPFESWMEELEALDIDLFKAIIEEASNLFVSDKGKAKGSKKK